MNRTVDILMKLVMVIAMKVSVPRAEIATRIVSRFGCASFIIEQPGDPHSDRSLDIHEFTLSHRSSLRAYPYRFGDAAAQFQDRASAERTQLAQRYLRPADLKCQLHRKLVRIGYRRGRLLTFTRFNTSQRPLHCSSLEGRSGCFEQSPFRVMPLCSRCPQLRNDEQPPLA